MMCSIPPREWGRSGEGIWKVRNITELRPLKDLSKFGVSSRWYGLDALNYPIYTVPRIPKEERVNSLHQFVVYEFYAWDCHNCGQPTEEQGNPLDLIPIWEFCQECHLEDAKFEDMLAGRRRVPRQILTGLRAELYKNSEGKCAYCGDSIGPDFHADHIIPKSRGGSDHISNRAAACIPCNRAKHAKTAEEFGYSFPYPGAPFAHKIPKRKSDAS